MKTAKNIAILTGLMIATSPAIAQSSGEIGYAKGSLGYDALVSGDTALAMEQLEQSKGVDANDPARLINLGQVYARMGRMGDAAQMFKAALRSDRDFDLVLASGEIVNSRDAAALALQKLNNRIASR